MKSTKPAQAVLTAFLLTVASSHAATFSDGSFSGSWNSTSVQSPPGSSSSRTSIGFTGNPGLYFDQDATATGGGPLVNGHFRIGTFFTPATDGAVTSISLTIDGRDFTPDNDIVSSLALALRQDGSIYATSYQAVTGGAWLTYGPTTYAASDFTRISGSGPLLPDFSAAGSALQLGYASQLLFTSAPSDNEKLGVDNWTVTVNAVPEPATAALLLIGGGLCWCCRALRRK